VNRCGASREPLRDRRFPAEGVPQKARPIASWRSRSCDPIPCTEWGEAACLLQKRCAAWLDELKSDARWHEAKAFPGRSRPTLVLRRAPFSASPRSIARRSLVVGRPTFALQSQQQTTNDQMTTIKKDARGRPLEKKKVKLQRDACVPALLIAQLPRLAVHIHRLRPR
jgi:hypothetical protein